MIISPIRNIDRLCVGDPTTLQALGTTIYITPMPIAGDELLAAKYLRFYGGYDGSGLAGTTLTYHGAFLRADTIRAIRDIGKPFPWRVFGTIARFTSRFVRDVANRHILQEVYFDSPVILHGNGPLYLAITADATDALLSGPGGSDGQTLYPSYRTAAGGGRIGDQIQSPAGPNAGISFLALSEIGCVRYLP